MAQQQSVLAWLKDAHAMEEGGTITLTNHAAAAQDYPEVQRRLQQHAETTRRHAELIEGCIERLGGRPSALKEVLGTVMGKVQGVANLPAKDTVVKNALGDFAAENFEIACYRSLIAAAEEVGDRQTADVCGQILRDEEEMAGWLAGQIPAITRTFLSRQAGEGDESQHAQAGTFGTVKQTVTHTVKDLGEQGKGMASSVVGSSKKVVESGKKVVKSSKKDAMIVSGAILAGAGAAMLIAQALRGGSGERQARSADERYGDAARDAYDKLQYDKPQMGSVGGNVFEGSVVTERPVSKIETADLLEPEPSDLNVDALLITDVQVETQDLFDTGATLDTGDLLDTAELPREEQITIDTLSEDARFLVTSDAHQEQGTDEALGAGGAAVDGTLDTDETSEGVQASTPAAPESGAQGVDETLTLTEVWVVPGPYSGLGPIGYDSAGDPIGQEVYSRLSQHGHVDATEIEIVIDNGEVLLEGTVDSEATKRLAEEAVASISEVRSVQNLLRVRTDENN